MKIEIEKCDNGYIVTEISENNKTESRMVIEIPEHEHGEVMAMCSLFYLLIDRIDSQVISKHNKIRMAIGLMTDDNNIEKDIRLSGYRFFKEE